MKKLILLTLLLSGLSQAMGQHREAREKLESYRIQYITERLDLSPEEAQVFWPVYNEYRQQYEKLKKEYKEERAYKKHADLRELSEKEKEALVRSGFKKERALIDLREEYFGKFQKAIGMDKVTLLYKAEKDFQRKLIDRLSDRRRR